MTSAFLVEVPAHPPQAGELVVEALEGGGDDVNDFALPVDAAADEHGVAVAGDAFEAVEDVGVDDEVAHARLVFEREERDALGTAGALADEADAGDGDGAAGGEARLRRRVGRRS